MFVVAPLFLVLLLAWVERGAPRPRVLTLAAAAASALLVLAIPFERFIETAALSDTLMLLPWWNVQDHVTLEWVAELALLLAVALAAAFVFVPRRYALVLPLARARVLRGRLPPDLVREARRPAGVGRRSLPGNSRRSTRLDRRRPARGRTRVGALDGSRRPLHRQPERVLQPHRRRRLLHASAHAGRHRRDGGAHRPTRRLRPAPRRTPARSRVPARRRLDHAGRRGGRARRPARHDALAHRRRGGVDDDDPRPVPERHLVARDRRPGRGGAAAEASSSSRCRATRRSSASRRLSSRCVDGERGRARLASCRARWRRCACRSRRRARPASSTSASPRPRCRPRSRPAATTGASSARTSTSSCTSPLREDPLRREPAVAPAARDRELHPRVARRSRGGGRRAARDRRVRADEPEGARADPGGARGGRRRAPDLAAAVLARAADRAGARPGGPPPSAWSAPSTCSTSATGCTRRSAQASARRRSTTSSR